MSDWLSRQQTNRATLAVDDLCLLFVDHAKTYYRSKDGEPTSEVACIRHALRLLIKLHGRCRVREFGPLKLKEVRQAMIDAGMCRTNINRQVHRIRRVFSWAVGNEIVPVTVYQALCTVEALKAGRSAARETSPIRPVDEGTVKDNRSRFLSECE